MYIDVTAHIDTLSDDVLEVTLCCCTQHDAIERVTVYIDPECDVPLPAVVQAQLQKWAEYYVDTDPRGRVADAILDAQYN